MQHLSLLKLFLLQEELLAQTVPVHVPPILIVVIVAKAQSLLLVPLPLEDLFTQLGVILQVNLRLLALLLVFCYAIEDSFLHGLALLFLDFF